MRKRDVIAILLVWALFLWATDRFVAGLVQCEAAQTCPWNEGDNT